ncbi:hypothetical protein AMAG_06267 [Allomyces macrogynus ATCC 38327]|uniref:Uncharacterized protein n=1 Tax=Allomyces macrogynus (strain ATCC 38327) TaxID=578462 RepID=A0A0L0SG15_ALLM3|nr:hypothetical protein AMAG_06267 [Allomyces macrogynus ATCC 38327]|eukprot:KNE61441.1 hypothetical protein AMAG_06267 [Allomyces macrogynus ATCC 38327]
MADHADASRAEDVLDFLDSIDNLNVDDPLADPTILADPATKEPNSAPNGGATAPAAGAPTTVSATAPPSSASASSVMALLDEITAPAPELPAAPTPTGHRRGGSTTTTAARLAARTPPPPAQSPTPAAAQLASQQAKSSSSSPTAAPAAQTSGGGGGWGFGSWLSSVTSAVVQETTAAKDRVAKAVPTVREMTTQLLSEGHHATEKVTKVLTTVAAQASTVTTAAVATAAPRVTESASSLQSILARGMTSVLDAVAPEARPLPLRLRMVGRCNLRSTAGTTLVGKDARELLASLLMEHALRVEWRDADDGENAAIRTYLPEELLDAKVAGLEAVWAESLKAPQPDHEDELIVFLAPAVWPTPTGPDSATSTRHLVYVVRVQGPGGRSVATLSQSIRVLPGKPVDQEWERLVVRSAMRASLDEWVEEVMAAAETEAKEAAERARAAEAEQGAADRVMTPLEQANLEALSGM